MIPLRNDEYGLGFYVKKLGETFLIPWQEGSFSSCGIDFRTEKSYIGDVLRICIEISAKKPTVLQTLGLRTGIDTYMESYPQWDEKFFPTALRCEKKGFWSCFQSTLGKIISICSPNETVSWKNEYNRSNYGGIYDVGHRIYTSSIEFINELAQPPRHPKSNNTVFESREYTVYYSFVRNEEDLRKFVRKYSRIIIPHVNKFTYEVGETAEIDGRSVALHPGLNTITAPEIAEIKLFVRRDWFYYLECAAKSAEVCQQKPGTHCESWYGYFSRVAYAKEIQSDEYTKRLCDEFDGFFKVLTDGDEFNKRLKEKALPHRLQNVSAMLSLLADFYELTKNQKYLNFASGLAESLMKLQADDGSYRNHNTHYTCVIYPAKSMIELSLAEKTAGFSQRAALHFSSAYKAIKNLEELKDDINTEGQMTFEDGMISCEVLQLAYLSMLIEDKNEALILADTAQNIFKKHLCLQQHFLPDCRTRGCTLRFWEARYDVAFIANMLNSPHGWTSWKNYASYYLYMLTGNLGYLNDLMDTLGACMQCVDEKGELRWSFVSDPCVVGLNLKKGCKKNKVEFEKVTIGEDYLPMISDWYRQDDNQLVYQSVKRIDLPETWGENYGGSCDNDVHEHFKCLHETVFGKAFIHQKDNGEAVIYNCREENGGFASNDKYLKEVIVYARISGNIKFGGNEFSVNKGFNHIKF